MHYPETKCPLAQKDTLRSIANLIHENYFDQISAHTALGCLIFRIKVIKIMIVHS